MSYVKSDHYDGHTFFNLKNNNVDKGFFDIIKWRFTSSKIKWPEFVSDNHRPQIKDVKEIRSNEVYVTYINHASHLIQLKDINILTDPLFSSRASPFSWIGPKRVRAAGILIEELPNIDLVLISHNHFDHLDQPSIKQLIYKFNPTFIVPIGNKQYIEEMGSKKIIELDWWQTTSQKDINIVVVPAQHWSLRFPGSRNKALWSGFIIESAKIKILFSGDCGYSNTFKDIKEKFGQIDISIIPIGSYSPRWFMQVQHMDPEDAVKAHIDLNSNLSIANHYGTFQLSDEGIDDPIKELKIQLKKYNIADNLFLTPKNGETLYYISLGGYAAVAFRDSD
ncbi:MAG: MBL fold metallo-hydrolase [Oligoflexia bacterium]|nr:MBL fold metallo-hydrolase [Oligoflexia bacterium]